MILSKNKLQNFGVLTRSALVRKYFPGDVLRDSNPVCLSRGRKNFAPISAASQKSSTKVTTLTPMQMPNRPPTLAKKSIQVCEWSLPNKKTAEDSKKT